MKYKTLQSISKNIHHNYKIPKNIAVEIVRNVNLQDMKRQILGAIKSFQDAHDINMNLKDAISLEKRISGELKVYFARILVDRYILNWLCTNRIDLSKVTGELRNGLLDIILSQQSN